MRKGIVFRIQRYSIHDGPGIRTAVFLKGCPLDCWWCHNPEGKGLSPVVIFHEDRCLHCGRCDGQCTSGGQYADLCPGGAREIIGQEMTVASVMEVIEKDSAFYDESGGGVTFTGGEPFMQYDFLYELLLGCRKKGIHTAIETSGYTAWSDLKEAARLTGLFLYDLKLMDNKKHIQYMGVSNELIADNLSRLATAHDNICVRIPVIPGINDDDRNIDSTCAFLKGIGLKNISILPYHNTGSYKYEQLGLDYRLSHIRSPDKKDMQRIADTFGNNGFNVYIGGSAG